jgi:uncharacterized protein
MHYRTVMRFTLDRHPTANLVTHIGPAGIRVGEFAIRTSVVLSATQIVTDWPVPDLDALSMEALAPALELSPEVLVLGTGRRLRFPEARLFAELAALDIGLEVMDTSAACRTYNILVNEGRPVVAALILP